MTTFSYPVDIKLPEPPGPEPVNLVQARVPSRYSINLDTTKTGTAAGVTTIPLFVAPAGATFFSCSLDVLTAYDNLTTNVAIGTAAIPDRLHSAVSVNTGGRRAYSPTAAQISVNAIPLTANTTVVARVSIDTSTVTAGSFIVHVEID